MLNRWYHPVHLHAPLEDEERKVGWLELFYDLIFVATFIQLGNALAGNIGLGGILAFFGLFVPIWWTWTGFTFYANRFVVDDFLHRCLVFVQMFSIGALAISIEDVMQGSHERFALAYAVGRLVLVAQYWRAARDVPEAREMTQRLQRMFGLGAALWAVSAAVPTPWAYVLWATAMVVDLSGTLSGQTRELARRLPPDVEHMSERYGLLTIIVLGEGFVKVLGEIVEKGPTFALLFMSGLGLAITSSIWWIYFDDVAGSRLKKMRGAAYVWVYTHLPLAAAITAVGVALKKAAYFEPGEAAPVKYRVLLCSMVGLAFLSVALIDWVTERKEGEMGDRVRVAVRGASGVLILLLAPAGAGMSAAWFVGIVAAACVGQVLVDLSTNPYALPPVHHPQHAAAKQATLFSPAASPGGKRWDASEAVRKGAPPELRNDLYFYLMEGTWLRLFGWVVALYLFTNIFFAGLYLLDPNGVSNLDARSFLDAFSFSVQTLSTIGYGTMSPETPYAHSIVAVEALAGLLGVALTTGLIFAKAARPHAQVLWSDAMVINTYDGRPTLGFRVANARSNEIAEAQMTVVVLKDEVSPEGHRMRRLYDLKLQRSNSPIFVLSWSVFHVIDEDSPLYGITEENRQDAFFIIVAILTGHDSIYAQTVHSRHIYYPENLAIGGRFVDVIGTLPDGRLQVDLTKFHDVVMPEED